MWLGHSDRQKSIDHRSTPSYLRLSKQNKRPRVFVVHEDPASRTMMSEMLAGRFEVRQFENGEQALRALEESWPDVLVLDVVLPGLDGVEICRRVKARAAEHFLPVVLLTAADRPGERTRALEAGADDFVSTPLYASELAARVGNLGRLAWYERQQAVASERLKTMQAQLEEAERLATMGTFASGLGHEMNNVVTVIRSALEDVRQSNCDGEVVADLSSATTKLEELAGAVRRLASPARADAVVDLRDVVRDVVWMTRIVGRTKYVTVDVSLPETAVVARVPSVQAQQVVLNLLTNAADALTHSSAGRIAIRLRTEAGWVHLVVQDNGPGIPPDARAHLGDPVFTTKSAGLGTGLGLALVRQLVSSWAGTLEVSSSSAGTTVDAHFPAERAPTGS
jgi:C4-dicarboxylate-specific signal transduction histidine kinase